MASSGKPDDDNTPSVRDALKRDDAGYAEDGQRPPGPGVQGDPIEAGSQVAAPEDDRIAGIVTMVRGDVQLGHTSDPRGVLQELLAQNGIDATPELLDRLEREVRG